MDFTIANTALAALVLNLKSRQALRQGRYRQCLASDRASWGTWDFLKPVGFVVEVHEYLAPDGPGWTVVAMVRDSATVYQKVVLGKGPETWRAQDWQEVANG